MRSGGRSFWILSRDETKSPPCLNLETATWSLAMASEDPQSLWVALASEFGTTLDLELHGASGDAESGRLTGRTYFRVHYKNPAGLCMSDVVGTWRRDGDVSRGCPADYALSWETRRDKVSVTEYRAQMRIAPTGEAPTPHMGGGVWFRSGETEPVFSAAWTRRYSPYGSGRDIGRACGEELYKLRP